MPSTHRALSTEEAHDLLLGRAPITPALPVPASEWPAWASTVALLRQPEDAGVGDTIARVIGPIGGDAYKSWYQRIIGKPCGCTERQADWNARYRYADTK